MTRENKGWPVKIVDPEIEDCWKVNGKDAAKDKLIKALSEDYDSKTSQKEIDDRSWFGRCVYESSNDVCDNQVVTMTWEDETSEGSDGKAQLARGFGAKTATLQMIAFTEKICERRGRVYGTRGEIEYDSKTIRVHDFRTGKTQEHHPHQPGGGHGGGDDGLTQQFLKAVYAVNRDGARAEEAQTKYIGCSLEDVIRSHAMVFAADEARKEKKVVDWRQWWGEQVEGK